MSYKDINFAAKLQTSYERFSDYPDAGVFQRIYDLCVVWTPETAGDENNGRMAAYPGDPPFLGTRLFRVLYDGPGQPDRFHFQRRAVQSAAAESDPGGDFPHRLHRHRGVYFQRTTPSVEPLCGIYLPDTGGFLRVPQIKFGDSKNLRTFALPTAGFV